MGDEVKITVIATGFRDQMPERRARMLTVEEAPVLSIPVEETPTVKISLVESNNWLREPVLESVPPRFLSQGEDEQEDAAEVNTLDNSDKKEEVAEPCFFSASANYARSFEPAVSIVEAPMIYEHEEMEPASAPAPPRFAELSEEPAYTRLLRDYAPEFAGLRSPAIMDEYRAQPAAMLVADDEEENQPDLDKPTFMRRSQS